MRDGEVVGPRHAVLVAVLLATVAASCGPPKENIRFSLLSGRMPLLSGPTLDGSHFGPSDYRGKVVVVNFWASWCGPCRKEQPGLERLWRDLRTGGVAFIGVDSRDGVVPAQRHVREFGVTYPSVRDPDGRIGESFGVPYLPATIIVAPTGQMRYRLVGAQEARTIRALVETLQASGG